MNQYQTILRSMFNVRNKYRICICRMRYLSLFKFPVLQMSVRENKFQRHTIFVFVVIIDDFREQKRVTLGKMSDYGCIRFIQKGYSNIVRYRETVY